MSDVTAVYSNVAPEHGARIVDLASLERVLSHYIAVARIAVLTGTRDRVVAVLKQVAQEFPQYGPIVEPKATRPYVQAACLCERVLVEADKVPSIIRMVDTYYVDLSAEPQAGDLPPKVLALTAFVALKAGDAGGSAEIGLRLRQPNGKAQEVQKWPVVLGEPYESVNLTIQFALKSPEMGLYWFDVVWGNGEEILTSIPFRLLPMSKTSPAPTA